MAGEKPAPNPKELPSGWGEVVKALTNDALKGEGSPIFEKGILTGERRGELGKLTDDMQLNNERRQGLVDIDVSKNFVHFLDLFEDLTQSADPAAILKTINESIQNGKPGEAVANRASELADQVIGKFCVGPYKNVVSMTDEDVNNLREKLFSDKTSGWIFMFSLMRLPGKDITFGLFSDMDFIYPNEWINMVKNGLTTDLIGELMRKRVENYVESENDVPPPFPGEETPPKTIVQQEKEAANLAKLDILKQLPTFIIRYLENPLLATHIINQHDPQEEWKNEKGLNAYIEKVLLKK